MRSKQFLFVWWEGGGNIPPALELVRRLVARGHRVHVLGDPVSEGAFRLAGATYASFSRAPHRMNLLPENDPLRDWEARTPRQSLAIMRDRMMFGPALAYAEDTMEQIDRVSPDAIAIMDFTMGAMVAAESAGIPAAVVAPHILAYPVPGRPPFGPGFLPARNGLERLRDRAVAWLSQRELAKGLPILNAARTEFGLAPVRGVFDQVLRVNRILVLTSSALELPGGPLPGNVRYAGPILSDPAWTRPWALPWSDFGEPLVLVSFSTTFQNQAGILRKVIAALGELPVRALVTLGPAMSGETFPAPANVVVCESAPHSRVLPHASAMITHAGHGSVVRALANGVPLVLVPMGRDQNDIAARVVYHGAGLSVAPDARGVEFGAALKRVLGEPKFLAGAKALGKAITRDARASTAVAELEALAGAGRTHAEAVEEALTAG